MSMRIGKASLSLVAAIVLIVVVLGIVVWTSSSREESPPRKIPAERKTSDEAQPGKGDAQDDMGGWSQYTTESIRIIANADEDSAVKGEMKTGVHVVNADTNSESNKTQEIAYVGVPDGACGEEATPSDHFAILKLEVEKSGTYYPWARVWWKDSCGDSLAIQIGEETENNYPITDGIYKQWHWLQVAGSKGINLEKGTYTIRVENREDGARLDKILFIDSDYASYTPSTPQG